MGAGNALGALLGQVIQHGTEHDTAQEGHFILGGFQDLAKGNCCWELQRWRWGCFEWDAGNALQRLPPNTTSTNEPAATEKTALPGS